jgi:hypothetical protein
VASAIPSRYPDYPKHSRLEAIYSPEESGKKNIVTLLNPLAEPDKGMQLQPSVQATHDAHLIQHKDGAEDLVFNSHTPDRKISFNGLVFKGDFFIHRAIAGDPGFIFVKNATALTGGELEFKAEHKLTLWMKHRFISVLAKENTVLYLKSKTSRSLYIDDKIIENPETEDEWMKIPLPKGTHKLYFK